MVKRKTLIYSYLFEYQLNKIMICACFLNFIGVILGIKSRKMGKAFQAFNHGTGKMDLTKHKNIVVMRPTEIHLKEDGSKKNEPSFAIVMTDFRNTVVGEISLEMLNDGLADIGYEVVRRQKTIPHPGS